MAAVIQVNTGVISMETRVAVISIIVTKADQVDVLNDLLHEYSEFILGRMGVPYREKNLNIISIAIDAPMDSINSLSGALGRLDGVNAKVTYAKS
jgi:putative iron-only hydrogenase system regulator